MVLEECGAALAPIPLLSSIGLAAGALRGSGLDSVLADIAGGVVATLAVHSPGYRLPGPPMTLQDGRLRGRAVAVPNLSRAELIVTLAQEGHDGDRLVAAVARCGRAPRSEHPGLRVASPLTPHNRWPTSTSTPNRWPSPP